MSHQIRTQTKFEDHSTERDKERGSRFWSTAEIMTTTWFVVETCVDVRETVEIRRWITTSIEDASEVRRSQAPYRWGRVFDCI
jgi:hypothetical protein